MRVNFDIKEWPLILCQFLLLLLLLLLFIFLLSIIGAPHQYYYTNQGDSSSIDGVDDKKMFGVFINGLDQLGFVEQQKRQLFNLLGSILHLGNVQVKEASNNDSSCVPEDQESLKQSSLLLGVSSSSLSRWLCNRQIITTREVLTKPLTVSQVKTNSNNPH